MASSGNHFCARTFWASFGIHFLSNNSMYDEFWHCAGTQHSFEFRHKLRNSDPRTKINSLKNSPKMYTWNVYMNYFFILILKELLSFKLNFHFNNCPISRIKVLKIISLKLFKASLRIISRKIVVTNYHQFILYLNSWSFINLGIGKCLNFDECSLTNSYCVGGTCIDTEGSYICQCPPVSFEIQNLNENFMLGQMLKKIKKVVFSAFIYIFGRLFKWLILKL